MTSLEKAQETTDSLGLLDRILLADSYRMLSKKKRSREVLDGLAARVDVTRGDRESIIMAGELLAVGMKISPDDDAWPRLARKLVLARRGTGWGDTQTDSAAVRGLAAVLSATGQEKGIPVAVHIDGQPIGVLAAGKRDLLEVTVPRAKRISLMPRNNGGADFHTVTVTGYQQRPPRAPANAKAKITTRVFQVQPTRKELKPNAAGVLRVERGRTLEIVAEVELRKTISHARFTIPRPCGVELIRPPKYEGGIVASEQRDAGLHFFVERWDPGTHTVRLLVRPELSGCISTGLPELSPMYDDPVPTAVDSALRWVVE